MIRVGDVVERVVANQFIMRMVVTRVTEDLIHCGLWKFSRRNGAEIDEDLGWDENSTGSFLRYFQNQN